MTQPDAAAEGPVAFPSAGEGLLPRRRADARLSVEPDESVRRELLLVFARCPEPGRVKTRLIPALGAAGAAQLHEAMIRRTLAAADRFRASSGAEVLVCVAGEEDRDASQSFGPDFACARQTGDDLGARLNNAVQSAFRDGARRVLVIGTDCPELDSALLGQANNSLQTAELVLGPAHDGGYYLIGMREHRPELFKGIAWGTDAVLRQTMQAAQRSGLTTRLLGPLSDIDYPEDLLVWRRLTGQLPGCSALNRPGIISVVIPALNEATRIGPALRSLMGAEGVEVIIADGGSDDGTIDIAKELSARVIPTRRGRARQMNAGAALATGDVLLFLHADARLPHDFQQTIRATLDSGCRAGAFRLRLDGSHRGLRWIEWGANLRSRLFQLPYGDQGLFLKAEQFYRMGGFADLPLMEDFEFCRRLRRTGRIAIASCAVTTSARRWLRLGLARTTLINQLCVAGYLLGIPPHRLASLYSQDTGGD